MLLIGWHKKIFRKLFPDKTPVDFPGGYIHNRFFREQVKGDPILIIGDYTGRDYQTFIKCYKQVYLLDVVDTGVASKEFFVHQSITDRTPFPDGYFKYVIMPEVIEHIWEDKKALEEIHRILKPNGKLLLSVPFYADVPEYHYHIYSPKTIVILLKHSGFSIVKKQYRGIITAISNNTVAFFAVLLFPVFRSRSLLIVNEFLYKAHKVLGGGRRLNGLFNSYGVIIIAEKSGEEVDSITIQQKNFGINNVL